MNEQYYDIERMYGEVDNIGIKCYGMADEVWSINDDAIRPDYIISKYDK